MKKIIIHNADEQLANEAVYKVLTGLDDHVSAMANINVCHIKIDNGNIIDFRGGTDLRNLESLNHDFYTTDYEPADRVLGRMGAKRLFSLEEVLKEALNR